MKKPPNNPSIRAKTLELRQRPEQEPTEPARRKFLAVGAASVAGLALGGHAGAEEKRALQTTVGLPPLSFDSSEMDAVQVLDPSTFHPQELPELPVISSHTETLEATLEATVVERFVQDPTALYRFHARSYGSGPLAPQLSVWPGQTLNLNFINGNVWNSRRQGNPPINCPSSGGHNVPNCLNTTNVHTHGLHVSPEEPADDVSIEVWPKDDPVYIAHHRNDPKHKNGSFPYRFHVRPDHAPGTHWYHAHRHGSTAYNVSQNQFGSLIVREVGNQVILPGITERTLLIATALEFQGPDEDRKKRGLPEPVFTVNGVSTPTITMAPNEVQRWRIISASGTMRGYNALHVPIASLNDWQFWLIAWDGITLSGAPRSWFRNRGNPSLVLAPGNRVDLLVRAPPQKVNNVLMRLGTDDFKICDNPGNNFPNPNRVDELVLAHLRVSGSPMTPREIPAQLPPQTAAYLRPIADHEVENTPKRTVTFRVTGGNGTADRFQVGYRDNAGGTPFGPAPYDPSFAIKVPLGSIEEWTILNEADQDHPYHIHVNPFQIVEIKEKGQPARKIPANRRLWSDTVSVPRRGYVKIRSRFVDFKGSFVLHCHILNHEDRGMMMNVEVI